MLALSLFVNALAVLVMLASKPRVRPLQDVALTRCIKAAIRTVSRNGVDPYNSHPAIARTFERDWKRAQASRK